MRLAAFRRSRYHTAMFRKESKPTVEETSADTVVNAGTAVTGNLVVAGSLRFDGRLSGALEVSGSLFVGSTGEIDAEVRALEARVKGVIRGNLRARESVELLRGARLEGDVYARAFRIEDGAVFQGNCYMGDSWTELG